MKTYTDIEQSKRLAAILDADTADLIYINDGNGDYMLTSMFYNDNDDDVPCWSLGALFHQLPCTLEVNGDDYNPVMQKSVCWSVGYLFNWKTEYWQRGEEPVDMLVNLIEKLHEEASSWTK